MANDGALIVALLTLSASALYFKAFAQRAFKANAKGLFAKFFSAQSVCLSISLTLLFMGLRQAAAFLGLVDADKFLFYALTFPVAASGIITVGVFTMLLTRDKNLVLIMAGLMALLSGNALVGVFMGGIEGPAPSYWGTGWTLTNQWAFNTFNYVLVPSSILASAIVFISTFSKNTENREDKRKLSLSFALFFILLAMGVGATGYYLLALRSLLVLSAWMALP